MVFCPPTPPAEAGQALKGGYSNYNFKSPLGDLGAYVK
jgi:hypothetical protein